MASIDTLFAVVDRAAGSEGGEMAQGETETEGTEGTSNVDRAVVDRAAGSEGGEMARGETEMEEGTEGTRVGLGVSAPAAGGVHP